MVAATPDYDVELHTIGQQYQSVFAIFIFLFAICPLSICRDGCSFLCLENKTTLKTSSAVRTADQRHSSAGLGRERWCGVGVLKSSMIMVHIMYHMIRTISGNNRGVVSTAVDILYFEAPVYVHTI